MRKDSPLFLPGIGDFFWRCKTLRVIVNGEEYMTEKQTISQLLKEMGITPDRVAVEVNLKVIKRSDFDNFSLKEGDVIEIVRFVGGGKVK